MANAEALRSYGSDTSLREIPGPNRTFESPESHLPLPGNISYYQELYPKEEIVFSQKYIDANKRLGKGLVVVSGIGAAAGVVAGIPLSLTFGVCMGALGLTHWAFFVGSERKQREQQAQLSPS